MFVVGVAKGIFNVVNEAMAGAARVHIAEKAQDPRRFTLVATGGLVDLLRKYSAQLPALFIVSQVEITEGHIEGAALATGLEGLQIRIERAKGEKCERCWNYSTHVGENSDYPTLCERCVAALAEIDRDSALAGGSVKV